MSNIKPAVTVVIPLYQDARHIGGVLRALRRQRHAPDYEVIVVDDGSTDEGPEIATAAGATVLHQANAGPAAARNRGADYARADTVLFLDADCLPPENWMHDMSAPMLSGGFDAVVGTICAANDGVVPRLVQSEVSDRYRSMAQSPDGVDFIAAPSCGTTLALRNRLGGFDETLRQAEDVELGYRISLAGGRIAFVQSAPVAHHHQDGWAEFLKVKYRRAMGRIAVLDSYPEKRRADNWTPRRFKAQVVLFGLGGLAMLLGLSALSALWLTIALVLVGGAVTLGWQLVAATAVHMRGLVRWPMGHVVGIAFLLARSVVIIAAVLVHKMRAALRFEHKSDRHG